MKTVALLLTAAAVPAITSLVAVGIPDAVRDARPSAAQDPDPVLARARLRLSGRMEGRLEPCGCASGQVGGLARRVFRNKLDRGYDFLIEGGGLVTGGTELDDLKLMTALTVLADRGAPYQAIGLGRADLRLPLDALAGYVEVFGTGGMPFVASDLVVADDAEARLAVAPAVDLGNDTAHARVASLTGALPADDEAARFGLTLLAAEAAWRRAMDGVADGAVRVLLVHDDPDTARRAAGFSPKPDLVVAIDGAHLEPPRAAEIVGGVPLVHPGTRGRFLLDVTIERTAAGPRVAEYEAFPLLGADSGALGGEDADARQQILQHRQDVADAGILEAMAGRTPTATGARYVGSQRCMPCHQEAWKVWTGSRHGHAWETLERAESADRYGWPVTKYPDCVACHTVGYGLETGFVNPERTPDLEGVGCEQCHGPGSEHVVNPVQNRLPPARPDDCRTCHDFEQSPLWNYAERWQRIQHK